MVDKMVSPLLFMWPVIFPLRIAMWCFIQHQEFCESLWDPLVSSSSCVLGNSLHVGPFPAQELVGWPTPAMPYIFYLHLFVLLIQVELGFSTSQTLPDSEVGLNLLAAPGSTCAVWAVDQSAFLLKPEKELSSSMVSKSALTSSPSFVLIWRERERERGIQAVVSVKSFSLKELKALTRRIKSTLSVAQVSIRRHLLKRLNATQCTCSKSRPRFCCFVSCSVQQVVLALSKKSQWRVTVSLCFLACIHAW